MSIDPGTLYYNGFLFPPHISANVVSRPVQDSTGRFEKYIEFSLEVEFFLYPGADEGGPDAPGSSTKETRSVPGITNSYSAFITENADLDVSFPNVRKLLTEDAGDLIFSNKGYGNDIFIASYPLAGTYRDVNYGPKPKLLEWEPVGGNKAVKVRWRVDSTYAECLQASNEVNNVAEFSYGVNWSINASGELTRTINGQVEISVPRVSAANKFVLRDHADRHRDRIRFPVIPGFRREQDFNLTPDRKFLIFTFTDTEIPSENPYFEHMVDMRVNHTVRNAGGVVGTQWMSDITGSITIAPGQKRVLMWLAFKQIFLDRFNLLKDESRTLDGYDPGTTTSHVWWTSFSVTEELFGRSMQFSASYTYAANLSEVLQKSGLWRPVPNVSWARHSASMSQAGGPHHIRGQGGPEHFFQGENEAMISLCGPQDSTFFAPVAGSRTLEEALNPDKCDDNKDYICFEPEVQLIEDSGGVAHYPLGGLRGVPHPWSPSFVGTGLAVGSTVAALLQSRHSDKYRVVFSGRAIRAGHTIPRPNLESYGGQKAHLCGKFDFKHKLIQNVEGCKTYAARWRGVYVLEGKPTTDLSKWKPSQEAVGKCPTPIKGL